MKEHYDIRTNEGGYEPGNQVWLFNLSQRYDFSPKFQRSWEGRGQETQWQAESMQFILIAQLLSLETIMTKASSMSEFVDSPRKNLLMKNSLNSEVKGMVTKCVME